MKKLIVLFSAAFALFACAKIESDQSEGNASSNPVTFKVKVAAVDDTKASAKVAWANGDVIYVVFKGITDKYLYLTYDGSKWNETATSAFTEGDFSSLGDDYHFTAVHFPVAVYPSLSEGTLSFTANSKPVYTYYMHQTGAVYSVSGAVVTINLDLHKADGYVQFHVPGITSPIADYSFAANDVKPVACSSIDASTGDIVETEKNVGAAFGGFLDADGAVFSAKLTKSGEQSYTFLLTSTEKVYSFTKTRSLDAGTFYKFKETSDKLWTTKKDTESMTYVDLGLPSGLKWGTCNLGAANECSLGKYYAWGEIEGYTPVGSTFSHRFDWSNYKYGSDETSLTKYCFYESRGIVDNKETLEAIDDAAINTLGTGWRIPTYKEMKELLDYCTVTWNSDYNSTGVSGIVLTGSNSKSIFMAAQGSGTGASLTPPSATDGVRFWTATLMHENGNSQTAWRFSKNESSHNFVSYFRYVGWAIRPVHD